MLPPMAAGAAMAASSVSVVGSSLLLKFWQRPRWMTVESLERDGKNGEGLKGMGMLSDAHGLGGRVSRGVMGLVRSKGKVDDGYLPLQDIEGF